MLVECHIGLGDQARDLWLLTGYLNKINLNLPSLATLLAATVQSLVLKPIS